VPGVDDVRYLIQILLPLNDNEGTAFGPDIFGATRAELAERFGGLTAHVRAPARGLWKTDDGAVARDDIVILEVMVEELDRTWWSAYRERLESRFRQDEVVIRALAVQPL
jgi:hypothetical protein